MKRVIIGNGKVANVIKGPDDVILSHKDIEITDRQSVESAFRKYVGPKVVVINTAAKINLEWCEANKLESHRVNVVGPLYLADACHRIGAKFVHISSGCVFDGNHVAFREDMDPRPAAWYSRTKVWADEAIANHGIQDYLLLRPRQLISAIPNPTNMLTKFLDRKKLKCITEANSMTCIEDFKLMVDHLIAVNVTGIVNCANTGVISPLDVAIALKKIDPTLEVEAASYEEFLKTISVKRVNTVLDLTKLISSGHVPRSAWDALNWCVDNYGRAT